MSAPYDPSQGGSEWDQPQYGGGPPPESGGYGQPPPPYGQQPPQYGQQPPQYGQQPPQYGPPQPGYGYDPGAGAGYGPPPRQNRNVVWILVALVVVAAGVIVTVLLVNNSGGSSASGGDAKAVAQQYADAVNRRDANTAKSLSCDSFGSSTDNPASISNDAFKITLEVLDVTTDGDSATARMKAKISGSGFSENVTVNVSLEKQGGSWKVCGIAGMSNSGVPGS